MSCRGKWRHGTSDFGVGKKSRSFTTQTSGRRLSSVVGRLLVSTEHAWASAVRIGVNRRMV
jgi:hypothetical protein